MSLKSKVIKFIPAARYFMEVAFDGTDYNGWQWQPDAITIQEVIENTLTQLYAGTKIAITGSSRTDAGVHANAFAVSFSVPARPAITPFKLHGALNNMLPDAIRIRSLKPVELDFHARFNAKGKAYTYIINHGQKSPFNNRYTLFSYQRLNIQALREAAALLVGTHDFASFAVNNRQYKTTVRTIFRIDIQEFGDLICITFIGNGFLYKMIRCIIGTLLAVATGKSSVAEVSEILAAKERDAAHNTALPHGLFLMKVFYNEPEIEKFALKELPFMSQI
jgi:tRNA pseudouridine38-40 synthase